MTTNICIRLNLIPLYHSENSEIDYYCSTIIYDQVSNQNRSLQYSIPNSLGIKIQNLNIGDLNRSLKK